MLSFAGQLERFSWICPFRTGGNNLISNAIDASPWAALHRDRNFNSSAKALATALKSELFSVEFQIGP
jgi:hypothetical protein